MNAELLTQLQTLIADAEANQADAELWRETRRLMALAGYGPRITPAQIVDLVPNVHLMNEFVAATQEVVPPQPAGSKMPRRKLTPDDEQAITSWQRAGGKPEQIAKDRNISLSAVEKYLDAV